MAVHHLAQLNVARMLTPTDSPVVADFMNNLDPINALAEAAPGFIWRLQTDEGNATSIRVSEDDLFLINLSVWESIEQLHEYVYRSDHAGFVGRRLEWFERATDAYLVLWWIPAGHMPSTEEAMERLSLLRRNGPTDQAFTFKAAFAAPA